MSINPFSFLKRFSREDAFRDLEPIRAEISSVERLEQYAVQLAAQHEIYSAPVKGRRLLPRLDDNARVLISVYRTLAEAIRGGRPITPAAEWLVDNFHIVDDQLREIRQDLPKGYYYELPKLKTGELAGYPRIYSIALELVAHTDSRLDVETLRRFVRAYQREKTLTIGELWAIAISLRLALVENLRRLAVRTVSARAEREEADKLADRLLETAAKQPEGLIDILSERLGKQKTLDRAFVVQMTQRLRDQDPAVMLAYEWLDKRVRRSGTSTEQLVLQEHQRQAAAQVTVGNVITSMRLLSTLDWRDFVESVSLVEPVLAEDPARAYSSMDFATRDRYRHVIERIAKRAEADVSEMDVARKALEMAREARRTQQTDERQHHVGYYLIDDGCRLLEKFFGYRPFFIERARRAVLRRPTLFYLGMVTLITIGILAVLLYYAYASGASPLMMLLVGLLALIPASDLALSAVNYDVTNTFTPFQLPKMDTTPGVPDDARTMVVIPTLFTDEETINELVRRLEVHYLANQDDNIYFALLGDFGEAPSEEMPADAALTDIALTGIEELNARYTTPDGQERFHLFMRRRQWNVSEEKWIGWERKRGKLNEFNRLLRGDKQTSFFVNTAAASLLAQIRYVITLDSDTQLPRECANRLIGAITHPLNRAQLDPALRRVTRGYAILQPRVSVSLESSSRSSFARIFSGHTGIDPYTTAVSDVYQDLFGEGSFTGKGLYDVDAFEAALHGRVPENALLSHDLFESLYARAALVTDIELLDDYPAQYDAFAKRQHRWTRGDWQIARWLLPTVPEEHGRRTVPNQLPLISRWKIFDNLRRSLVAPAIVLWLLATWTIFPGPALFTLFAVLVLAFPVYAHVTTSLLFHPRGIPWTSHFWSVWGDVRTNTAQVGLTVTFLSHQAFLMIDAIARTFYRKLISHKHLLEWITAAQAESGSARTPRGFVRFMWPAAAISLLILMAVAAVRPSSLALALPFGLCWLLSPFVAYTVSRRYDPARRSPLTADDAREARLLARRTWSYFEEFTGEDDHWLPPDNFQENPKPVIAHRTSPTNIGMLLLSTIAARDFGYTGTLETVERTELTLSSLAKLQRFNGHFLNWYDTQKLEPLMPEYVSTVDSGNLAGDMIALKQSCIELPDSALFDNRVLAGLADVVTLINLEFTRLGPIRQRTQVVTVKGLQSEIEKCVLLVAGPAPQTLREWHTLLASLRERLLIVEDMVEALAHEHGGGSFEGLRQWVSALQRQTRQHQRDLETLTPWALIARPDDLAQDLSEEDQQAWAAFVANFDVIPTPAQIPEFCAAALRLLKQRPSSKAIISAMSAALAQSEKLLARLTEIARTCDRYVEEMDFKFLFDRERKVFVIGYNVSERRRDNSYYDLLASESRLASFVAIAKGDVPQEHWFYLGRQLTSVNGGRALISWTATMFEYLMPLLVMRSYNDTLLYQTYQSIVSRQIEYGQERGVPWGVSESAYNARDIQLNYQYGPFGVPGLGLKRGLSEDLVVSPYSTILAAMISPHSAVENARRLVREGALGKYGFYESIDYTPERLPQGQKRAVIHNFMTHHQGMILLSLANILHDNSFQRRFHAEPLVEATELLLQERVPLSSAEVAHPRSEEVMMGRVVRTLVSPVTRIYDSPDLPTPRTQVLSNGTYSLMITTAGSGYATCGPLAVTRWREDQTRDHWGSFCYVRDVRSGAVWSIGYQPTARLPQSYEVAFSEYKVQLSRRDAGIHTYTEIIVAPEDNAELRRISLTNRSSRIREIELTSYAEVVLAPPAADAAHPSFSNLFIETEFIHAENSLLARRRPRSSKDKIVWAVHTVVAEGETIGAVQYETDRSRFLGRGRSAMDPLAVTEDRPLSNTVGAVLDPVFSLRHRVRLQPNETVRVTFTTAIANSREEALMLADKYHDVSTFEREEKLAWTQAQVEMRHLNVDPDEVHLFQRLASRVLYLDPSLRPHATVLAMNTQTQSALWRYGISGDLPIVLVRISEPEHLNMVRQIIRGHEYLRINGLVMDLVILNDRAASYIESLQDELQRLIRASGSQAMVDKSGGVYLRRTDAIPEPDRILLHAAARVVIVTERGPLEDQLVRRPVEEDLPEVFTPRWPSRSYPEPTLPATELSFFNGLGGFRDGGREYVTVLSENQWTPAPWLNVIANAHDFGFQVTESGAGYTWSVNSRENRLTTWSNDWVSDPPSEIIYLRDEDSGTVWTPTPLPVRETDPYVVRHGQGYSVFEHTSHGISQELLMFVPLDAPVKISLLRLRNRTDRRRRISVTAYHELVLGVQRERAMPFIITELDLKTGAIFARNPYNGEFAGRVAFVATSGRELRTVTCDRKEFIGRNGSTARPAAMRRARLSGRVGAGLDPCAAVQSTIELAPGEAREVIILIGDGQNAEEARSVVNRFLRVGQVNEAFEKVLSYWDELLNRVQVKTPDAAMDLILNRWLLYQTLACRIWARSAFYQSGGAYGFRDQLQDVMPLATTRPDITRAQILRAAARQFKEGDVQHWWHPPTGRGVRTRFSDDLLWLPFVTAYYIKTTGDTSILDEVVPFIEAPLLKEGEDEVYLEPTVSPESATIFEHCARTLDRSLAVGPHDLPLMGSGDWNDGMNRVGHGGRGESVWVGWFLYKTLQDFTPFAEARDGEAGRAARYRQHVHHLKQAIEENAWDGDWYRRAYFDDGTPLGSSQNEECRIDSIVQSWGVISGAADPHRAARAMAAVEEYLIRRGEGLVMLFTPPFDRSALDPGYIKGYVPGVRENGGQYTHAAIWTMIAYAKLKDGDRAGELFALLNPINHASTRAGLHKYKVEPYVAAADVYAVWPHTGRGGWTWYTGSAGWLYRAGMESILGFQVEVDRLRLEPCIPRWWRQYEITYRHRSATYLIKVENPHGVSSGIARIEIDGHAVSNISEIPLLDDNLTHEVRVVMGDTHALNEEQQSQEELNQESV